jgi:hypothetical protein
LFTGGALPVLAPLVVAVSIMVVGCAKQIAWLKLKIVITVATVRLKLKMALSSWLLSPL